MAIKTLQGKYAEKLKQENEQLKEENKQLKVKSELLEENNKLLIQQKAQMYEDLDIAYEKIDKAIEKVKDISFKFTTDKCWYCVVLSTIPDGKELLEILEGEENE